MSCEPAWSKLENNIYDFPIYGVYTFTFVENERIEKISLSI